MKHLKLYEEYKGKVETPEDLYNVRLKKLELTKESWIRLGEIASNFGIDIDSLYRNGSVFKGYRDNIEVDEAFYNYLVIAIGNKHYPAKRFLSSDILLNNIAKTDLIPGVDFVPSYYNLDTFVTSVEEPKDFDDLKIPERHIGIGLNSDSFSDDYSKAKEKLKRFNRPNLNPVIIDDRWLYLKVNNKEELIDATIHLFYETVVKSGKTGSIKKQIIDIVDNELDAPLYQVYRKRFNEIGKNLGYTDSWLERQDKFGGQEEIDL